MVGRWRAGARTELRRQLRQAQRMRRYTLVFLAVLVLGAYPLFLLLQAAARDPAINSLNTLNLPDWAARNVKDEQFGSRWCIRECRFRERTLESARGPEETAEVYQRVLQEAGWVRWVVERCPEQPVPGSYTCWKRDEYTLDLWVRQPACAFDPLRNRPTVEPTEGGSASPSASASPASDCTGSAITIKVRNSIADDRGRGISPPSDPEDIDDPLLDEPTPASPGG